MIGSGFRAFNPKLTCNSKKHLSFHFDLLSSLSFQMMNNSSSASFELTVLAVPDWLAYSLIAVYSVVIIFASLGSILIITAVSRTKSNVYIGIQNYF